MNETVNLSDMAIADKVNRYVQAEFYAKQLAGLQKSAHRVGCVFVKRSRADFLSSDVVEHLALALIMARESYLFPKKTQIERYRSAEKRLEDGYAFALLSRTLSALDALGLRLQVRPEGYDLEALSAERMEWQTSGAQVLTPTTEKGPLTPSSTDGKTKLDLLQFFEELETGYIKNEHDRKN